MFSTVCWTTAPRREADGTITAETVINSGDAWFDGHFPGLPLLPAVAQLALAWEAVRPLAGADARLGGFRRVKFKEMVRPGQRLKLAAVCRSEAGDLYAFRLTCDGRPACTGSLSLRRQRRDPGAGRENQHG